MGRSETLKIVVIASMKRGLEAFIHREVGRLHALGHEIVLLPAKVGQGLYGSEPGWTLLQRRLAGVVSGNLRMLLSRPRRYVGLLTEAMRFGAVAELLLAGTHAAEVQDCDVLYATFGDRKLFVGYFLKQLLGIPLAVNIHAYEIYDNPNPALFRRALAACDQVSTVTEYNLEQLVARHGVDPESVSVGRIAVDLERYRPRSTFVVLIVAHFTESKGHAHLFEAVSRLADPKVDVWVVGGAGSSEHADVPGLADRYGITDQVAFFGPLSGPALEALYRHCDVFCLPCHAYGEGSQEGFPTVIAEAMAFGKPVISTHHTEIPRVLDHELLVHEGDVAGLTAALGRARDDLHLRERLGAENRAKADRLFGLGNVDRAAAAFVRVARNRVDTNSTAGLRGLSGEPKGRPS